MKLTLAAAFVSIIGVVCYLMLLRTPPEQIAWSGRTAITITGQQLEVGIEVYYLSARDSEDMARVYKLPTTSFIKQAQRLEVRDGQVSITMHMSGMQGSGKATSMQDYGGVLAIISGSEETRHRIDLANLDILKTRTVELPNP